MPKGIPNKPRAPMGRPGFSRLESKVDKLIEAHAALIAALTELVAKVNNPVMVATANMRPPQYGSTGSLAPAGSPASRAEWAAYYREITQQQTAAASQPLVYENASAPPSEHNLGEIHETPAKPFEPVRWEDDEIGDAEPVQDADPVQAMYDELASYAEEDETPPPPPDEAELWSKRLNRWRGQKLWMLAWGPRPGQEGCQVPPYLMGNGRG